MQIVTWYEALAQSPPPSIRINFQNQFSSLNDETKKKINDLIYFFGYLNKQSVKTLLTNSAVQAYYSKEMARLQLIQRLCLIHIIQNTPLDQSAISNNHLYDHISVHSFNSIEDCVAIDIKTYLLSAEFPLQETKALGCYSIAWIKKFIDIYDQKLQGTIQNLLQGIMRKGITFNFEQQVLLFKHSGIRGFKRPLSYGTLLCLWNPNMIKWMEKNFLSFNLLHAGKKYPTQPQTNTFQEFLIQNTIHTLFYHEKTFLPSVKLVEQDLCQIFIASETDRQNVIFYIDYLHELQTKQRFVFAEALVTLKNLVQDVQSPIYNFLHSALYFFHYANFFLVQHGQWFNSDPKWRGFLFLSLYRISNVERELYEIATTDTYWRKALLINPSVITFLLKHPDSPEWWGRIFLRQIIFQGSGKCPYLSINQHIEFIQKIEEWVGKTLPTKLFSSFLFLQSVKISLLDLFEKFKNLRPKKIENEPVLDKNLFAKWQEFHENFLKQIDYIQEINTIHCPESEKAFRTNIELISLLIQFSTYPSLIPVVTEILQKMEENQKLETIQDPYFVYFLDYLSILQLEEGLIILDFFKLDKKISSYSLLHAFLHSNQVIRQLSVDSEEKKQFIRKAISSMSLQEREKYDRVVNEKEALPSFKIDDKMLEFAKSHEIPYSIWGTSILRFTRSSPSSKTKSPYLNMNQHIELIEKIEAFSGCALPISLSKDLLYFQAANRFQFKFIEKCREIRTNIIKNCLSWIAVPCDCLNLSRQVIAEVELLTKSPDLYRTKGNHKIMLENLSSILSFAAYPRCALSFRTLIEFNRKIENTIHSFRPLVDFLPSGPACMTRWIMNEEKGEYLLNVILTNPSKGMSSCVFCIPLKLPKESDKRDRYFTLLFSAVDRLGKEVLTKEKVLKALESKEATLLNRLQNSLCNFPQMQKEWYNYFSKDVSGVENIDLFSFIETLHIHFLISFYYLLKLETAVQDDKMIQDFKSESFTDRWGPSIIVKTAPTITNDYDSQGCVNLPSQNPEKKSLIENTKIKTLSMTEKGICLLDQNFFEYLIKKDDYYTQLDEIYQQIQKKKESIFLGTSILDSFSKTLIILPFTIKFKNTIWKGDLEWIGEFGSEKINQEQYKLVVKSETIQMMIHPPTSADQDIIPYYIKEQLISPDECSGRINTVQSLTIKYKPLSNKEEFLATALQQVALLWIQLDMLFEV